MPTQDFCKLNKYLPNSPHEIITFTHKGLRELAGERDVGLAGLEYSRCVQFNHLTVTFMFSSIQCNLVDVTSCAR